MKKIVFSWVLVLLISACGIFKSTPERKPVDKPPIEKKEEVEDKKDLPVEQDETDTIKRDEVILDTSITSSDSVLSDLTLYNKKKQYSIKLLLPLLPLEKSVEVPSTSSEEEGKSLNSWNLSFMEYLAGFKLALSTFEDTVNDFSYRLSVVSTEDMDAIITNQQDTLTFNNADIVIGGVTRPSLEKLSAWAAEQNKLYISPWVPFQPVSQNTRFIQLSPSLQNHCDALTSYIVKEYKLEQIFLVSSDNNKDKVECFNAYFSRKGINTRFQEIILSESFELEELEELATVFSENDTNIIIIPESRNKAFLHRVISRLSVLNDYKFKIVGLPGWLKYDLLYNYFEKMPFILSVDQYLSKDSTPYQEFEKKYFSRFQSVPTEWSVKGYDQASFLAKGLHQFGLDLPKNLDAIQYFGLGMNMNFDTADNEQSNGTGLYDNVNKAVQIIEYKKHQFQKVSP